MQRIEYGEDRNAVIYYDVLVCWYLAFEITDPNFKPQYIPDEMIAEIEQDQRLGIVKMLPENDPGRKFLILKFFPHGV